MGLKYKIAALTEVAEAVRTLYKQEGDVYVLDVEGAVDRSRLDEFRNNNIQLQQQLDKLKDVDPAKYRELMELDRKVKEKQLIEAGKIDELVELRTTALREDLGTKLTNTEGQLSKANQQLAILMIDREVQAEAVKQGIAPTALEDVILRARALYTMENGQAVPKNGTEIVYGKDGKTPMPIGEFITGLKKNAPHLFAGSSGGGARGGTGTGTIDLSKASPLEKINAGLAASSLVPNLPGA